MKATIATYNECIRKQEEAAVAVRDEDPDHDSWLYQPSRPHVHDPTLCSSPIDPEDDDSEYLMLFSLLAFFTHRCRLRVRR